MFRVILTFLVVLQLASAPIAQATIQTAAYGGNFGDAFKGSFINSVVALGLADAQTGIGDVFANGANGGEGSLGHVLLHGLAGCVAAEAQGADCAAGAAGGIAGAVYSGLQKAPERGSYASDAAYQAAFESWKTDVLAKGELFSLTAAYVLSGGKAENVGAANLVSNSAIANNYLTHAQFDALESELRACGTNAECSRQVISRYTEISAEQQHDLALCGTDIACMAPHLQAIAQARNHPLRAAMLASRGVRSSALQEFEYQVEVAYLGHTESMFDTGLFEGIYTPNYSRYFEYPQWAASNCSGLAASACMAGFQQQLKSDLFLQGMGSGAQAFAISAGVGSIAVAPGAALALRQCAANPVCFSNLNLDLTVALGESTGATAGQMAFTVRVGGAIAGKLVLTHGDEIVSVIDDLGRVLRPVSQTPDDLGRFLVTTTDGVTGYLDDGRFVAEAIIGGKTCVYSCVIDGTTRYVGITDDVLRRGAEHMRSKSIEIEAIFGLEDLSRSDARAVEQTLIHYYGLGKDGGTLLNRINSISPTSNPTTYEQALLRGRELLDSVGYQWTN